MSIDVEIYMNNIIKFFRDNPKDLLNLITKDKEEEFYKEIKQVAISNSDKSEEVSLTQKQFIEICVKLNGKKDTKTEKINKFFIDTKYGRIYLN